MKPSLLTVISLAIVWSGSLGLSRVSAQSDKLGEMTGGGIQPGQLLGGSNEGGTGPDDDTDIKPDDITATILHSLGIDHHKTYYTSTGRPVDLVANGRVLTSLLAH